MDYNYQQEERELLLIDYIWRVLSHWRSIIVSMVVFAVVVGGLKYFKDFRDIQKQLQEQKTHSPEEQLEEMMSQLTDEEQSAVNQVLRFEDMKAEKEEYIDTATIMKLNRRDVNKNVLQYHVEFGKNSTELLSAYKSSFLTEDVMEEIAAVSDNMEVSDVQDMISASYDAQNGLQLGEDGKVILDDTASNESLYITIRGLSKEEVMSVSEVVKKAVSDYAKKAQEIYESHKITLTNEFYQKGKDDDVGTIQDDVYNQIYDYQSKINTLSGGFSEGQKAVLDVYNSMGKQGDDNNINESAENASISKKWMILGAFLGLFIIVGWEFLIWVIGGQVNSPEELIENYPIYNFGIFWDEKKTKKKKLFSSIDTFINRICYGGRLKLTCEENFSIIRAGIVEKAKITNVNRICLIKVGACNDQMNALCKRLKIAVEDEKIMLEIGNYPCRDGEEYSRMIRSENIIICINSTCAKQNDYMHLLQICKEYNVHILGNVYFV